MFVMQSLFILLYNESSQPRSKFNQIERKYASYKINNELWHNHKTRSILSINTLNSQVQIFYQGWKVQNKNV